MPTNDTYQNLVGPIPAPNTIEFLRWVSDYVAARKRQCCFVRTTKYFIDPVSGNDANAGTFAAPYQSMAPIRTRIAANENNFSVLIKRGTILRETAETIIDEPNIHIGSYGPFLSTGEDKPVYSHFTIQLLESTNPWTLAAGNRYTASCPAIGSTNPSGATAIGVIREVLDPYNPYRAVDSTAKVEAQQYSYYMTGTTIHLNPGTGRDPNTIDYEANPWVPGSPVRGLFLQTGCNGFWLDDVKFEGWGCFPQALEADSAVAAVQNISAGDSVVCITRCESYYDGRHSFCQENGGVGGAHIVENCQAGLLTGRWGASLFNSYSGNGGQECVFKECFARFAELPNDITGSVGGLHATGAVVDGGAFFGHTGTGTDKTALHLNIGCGCLDDRGANPRATAYADSFQFSETVNQGFCPGTNGDPLSWRVFYIGYKGSRVRSTTAGGYIILANRVHFINSVIRIRRTWNTQSLEPWFEQTNTYGCHFTNCIFELVSEQSDFSNLFNPADAGVVGPRLMNCAIIFRGTSDGTSSPHLYINVNNLRDKIRLANTVLIADSVYAPGSPTSGYPAQIAFSRTSGTSYPFNSTDCLRYIATAGCIVADSSPNVGFNNATGYVNLGTANNTFPAFTYPTGRGAIEHVGYGIYDVDDDSPLYGKGNTNPFADKGDCLPAPTYDFYGRPRPSTPSIGPFDRLTPSSGSSRTVRTQGRYS